jgi:predicted adenine nucleotide alpha hydrolase (AANH) superfamily ATPase
MLLHACCGPCSTAVIERLRDNYELTVFFYNPNIHPRSEYELRLREAEKVYKHFNVPFVVGEYDPENWFLAVKGLENEPEGGKRCLVCYKFRLERAMKYAKENNFDIVTTTITISPHHKADFINNIGNELAKKYNVKFLPENFKKKDGFLRSVQLSKELSLYRQEYCGCIYSKLEMERRRAQKSKSFKNL